MPRATTAAPTSAACPTATASPPRPAALCTRAVRAGRSPDPTTGAINTPIIQSTTFQQEAVGRHKGHTYSRASNPTVATLEAALGGLENAPPAVCFASGMAAITALFLGLLKAGDEVVVSGVVYGGTVRLLDQFLAPLGITPVYADASGPAAFARALTPRTRLALVETPGNPTLTLVDVPAIARLTKAAGIPLAVDNTFLTAAVLRPLDLGADVSVYSTTKYIEGHNATIGGALLCADTAEGRARLDRFRLVRKSIGANQSPFEAWLTLRGLATLPLRIAQHSKNAQTVAEFLEAHPLVEAVAYPGLPSFPQHALAQRQHRPTPGAPALHGGIIAFEVVGGAEAGRTLMNALRLCSLAENLGAVETLVTHPVTMTHGDVPREQRLAAGITDGLVRLSVGLEDPADVIADLDQALAVVAARHHLHAATQSDRCCAHDEPLAAQR